VGAGADGATRVTTDDRLWLLVHELRSPVAALDALAAAARVLPATGLVRIAELAAAAGRDIERLLSDADVLSLRPEEVELGSLLESLAQPGVTCSAESVSVICDPTRIRQALANLVGNGRRHGTAVTVTGGRRDEWIVVDVTDDGPGIEPGIDVFGRGVSGVGSSGYGLWLARAIAEAHGGTLTLESTPGLGATFTLSVPSPLVAND
jgi:signal transduction histidine kinase